MYRLTDWECIDCRERFESTIDIPIGADFPASVTWLDLEYARCGFCGGTSGAERLMSAPAPYMGEKVRNPICRGGEFDTVGGQKPPPLPEFDAHRQHTQKLTQAIAQLPDNASNRDILEVHAQHAKDAPRMADWREHTTKPEWKETKAEREQVKKRNKAKRERFAALKAGGNVNMRRDKVAGDPKI